MMREKILSVYYGRCSGRDSRNFMFRPFVAELKGNTT